jgi:hypothetical protein
LVAPLGQFDQLGNSGVALPHDVRLSRGQKPLSFSLNSQAITDHVLSGFFAFFIVDKALETEVKVIVCNISKAIGATSQG